MKLVLRTKSKEGISPLYSKISIEEKGRWVNLRIQVDVKEWNDASQSERKLENYMKKKGISKKVALIEEAIDDMRRHHRLTRENLDVAIENIVLLERREQLKRSEELKKELETKKKKSVKNFVEEYVQKIESGEIRTEKKEKFSKSSIKCWKQFRRVLLDFYKMTPFEWEDVNDYLLDRFISYMETVGYMKSTIGKYLNLFKTLIGIAERQGLHTNHVAYEIVKRPPVKEEDKGKKIYLTKDELSELYKMPLDGFDEKVRDVFLIGCYTAMRFSDYGSIEKTDVGYTHKGTKVIRITQDKTGGKVVIPVSEDSPLEELLKKYDYNVPNLWEQSLNRTIKQICKKLSETVPSLQQKERTCLTLKERRAEEKARKEGIELFEYDEKGFPLKSRWELVSSHTARRTCITNMYLTGIFTVPQMMSISGHTTEAMFYKYVKLSLDEKADKIASIACDGLF